MNFGRSKTKNIDLSIIKEADKYKSKKKRYTIQEKKIGEISQNKKKKKEKELKYLT